MEERDEAARLLGVHGVPRLLNHGGVHGVAPPRHPPGDPDIFPVKHSGDGAR